MAESRSKGLTVLFDRLRQSDDPKQVLEDAYPLIYEDLRDRAQRLLGAGAQRATLQPTALVNEAYLDLAAGAPVDWQGQTHFRAIAARAVRRALLMHVREKNALKRGGDAQRLTLSAVPAQGMGESPVEATAFDEMLQRLEAAHPRPARLLELRFYGGLSLSECAEQLGISQRSAERDWTIAKMWLSDRLRGG